MPLFCINLVFIRIIKTAVRNAGANLIKEHVRRVSEVAFLLAKASASVDQVFNTEKSSTHTIRSADEDICQMVEAICKSELFCEKANRGFSKFSFADPRRRGLQKIEAGWLSKFVAKSKDLITDDADRRHVELDDVDFF